jgi:hypothetical protein
MVENDSNAILLKREKLGKERTMPLIKIDSTHPEAVFDALKQMNIPEGAEFEVEKVENGILLKPVTAKPVGIKSPLATPYIDLEDQARRFQTLAAEMQALGIPEDSKSLDSDWWTEILKTAPEQQPKDFSLDD